MVLPIGFDKIGESPDIDCHQSVVASPDYYYTIHTDRIDKRSKSDWSIISQNTDPFSGEPVTHLNDGDYYNGRLYIPAIYHDSPTQGHNQRLMIYNADTLELEQTIDISAQNYYCSGLTVVPEDNMIVITDYSSNKLYKYSLSDFSYLGYIELNLNITSIQGITYKDGLFYISSGYIFVAKKNGTVIKRYPAMNFFDNRVDYAEGIDWDEDTLLWLHECNGETNEIVFMLKPWGSNRMGRLKNWLKLRGTDYIDFGNILQNLDQGSIGIFLNISYFYNFGHIYDNSIYWNDWKMYFYQNGALNARISRNGEYMYYNLWNELGNAGCAGWHYIVFTWEKGGNKRIYVNGVLVDEKPVTWAEPGTFYLGGGNPGNMKGKYDVYLFHVHNKVLSPDEVWELYKYVHGAGEMITDGLVVWCEGDSIDIENGVWRDKSGNGNDGIIHGATFNSNWGTIHYGV